jgi:hypothetical protein
MDARFRIPRRPHADAWVTTCWAEMLPHLNPKTNGRLRPGFSLGCRQHCSRANIFVLMFRLRGRIALWDGRPTTGDTPAELGISRSGGRCRNLLDIASSKLLKGNCFQTDVSAGNFLLYFQRALPRPWDNL